MLPKAIGEALRSARNDRGLTRHDVAALTRGRFRSSSIGAYERGERSISLSRFCELSEVYGHSPEQLLGDALDRFRPERKSNVVVDLNRLDRLPESERRVIGEFVQRVKAGRHDFATNKVVLRSGDIEALALSSGNRLNSFLKKVRPAVDVVKSPSVS